MTLVLALGLAGCGGGSSSTATSERTESTGGETTATIVPNAQAQVGDTTTCPVSGETFVVSESSPTAEHDGVTYTFCCPGCRERFLASPAQYVQTQPEPAPAS
jgi:YHS domain-containing protein